MHMDIGMIRGLGTLVVMIAFIGLSLWVFNRRRDRDSPKRACCPSSTTTCPLPDRNLLQKGVTGNDHLLEYVHQRTDHR